MEPADVALTDRIRHLEAQVADLSLRRKNLVRRCDTLNNMIKNQDDLIQEQHKLLQELLGNDPLYTPPARFAV